MAATITQSLSFLIKNIFFIVLISPFILSFPACSKTLDKTPTTVIGKLALPNGRILETQLALTPQEQTKGLSGIPEEQFQAHQAMLFVYKKTGLRSFWMPDTYFNLNIIFLDKNLKVLSIEKDAPAHPGYHEPPRIYRTQAVWARHVLEVKANSEAAREIKVGMTLKWISSASLSQIISNTHQKQ